MREEIREVQQKLGITAVYVTHDQKSEALAISDCIMLMEQGEIIELGAPQQIYPHAALRVHAATPSSSASPTSWNRNQQKSGADT